MLKPAVTSGSAAGRLLLYSGPVKFEDDND